MLEIGFALASRHNRFFVELVEVIRDELAAIGVLSSVTVGALPAPRENLVYCLVPPHEFFALEWWPTPIPPELLRRSIGICLEQPESHFFEQDVALGQLMGAVFDISTRNLREWERNGVAAGHFQLGYTPRWDGAPFNEDRDVDILFLGSRNPRRLGLLASYADSLWRHRSRVVLSDNSYPNFEASESFVVGEDKRALLRRTKVLLNIHAEERPYCEWLRLCEAILSGAVVVSEVATDMSPLQPGVHLICGRPENLGLLAVTFAEDDEYRNRIRDQAFGLLRDRLPLRSAVELLADAAERVNLKTPVPTWDLPLGGKGAPRRVRRPLAIGDDSQTAEIQRAVKDVKLDLIDLRRELDRQRAQLSLEASAAVEIVDRSASWAGASPRVSLLLSLYNYEGLVGNALDSVATSRFRSLEIVVVDDASRDSSLNRVRNWIRKHPEVPVLLIRHRWNRGLPVARNSALDHARGEFVLPLDADNELYPPGIASLVDALDGDREAAFAYGLLAQFDAAGPASLTSVGGWEPDRLREMNYIDAMALIRAHSLRELAGYTTNRRLHGWEDYDLWCRMADRGWRGIHVPEIVGRYRVSRGSMLRSITNISHADAFEALIERSPKLMAGLEISG
jgi:hypothetical protein